MQPTRRPPIVSVFAGACWMDVFYRCFLVVVSRPQNILTTALKEVLRLFPTPGAIPDTLLALFGSRAGPGPWTLAAGLLGGLASATLGYGLWKGTRWAPNFAVALVPASLLSVFAGLFKANTFIARGATIAAIFFGVSVIYVATLYREYSNNRYVASSARTETATRVVIVLSSILLSLKALLAFIVLSVSHKFQGVFLLSGIFPLFLLIALVLFKRKQLNSVALGLTAGISIVESTAITSVLIYMFPLMAFGAAFALALGGAAGVVILVSYAVNLLNIGFSLAALAKMPRPPIHHAGNAALACFLPLVVASMLAGAIQREIRRPDPRLQQAVRQQLEEATKPQRRADRHLQIVASCVFAFSEGHPDEGFPSDLTQIGPEGSQCIPADLMTPSDSGYEFNYEAGRSSASGRIDRFLYKASKPFPGSDPARWPTVSIDESGIYTSRFRSQENADLIDNRALVLIVAIRNCLEQYRFQDPANHYPADITTILKQDGREGCSLFSEKELKITEWPAGQPVTFQGYDLTYTAEGDKYTIGARPTMWAVRYFRSFLIDQSGIVHATPFNRAASLDDLEIKRCELFNGGICDGTEPPSLEFIRGGIPKE